MRRLRVLRVLAALPACLFALLLLGGTPAAHAHSALKDATPAPGATVGSGTGVVALTFGALRPGAAAKVALTGPDGTQVPVGRPVVADDSVVCAAVTPLRAGVTTLTYTVTAADGDEQTSAYQFEVSDGTEPAAEPSACRGLDLAAPAAPEAQPEPEAQPATGSAAGGDDTNPGLRGTTAPVVLAGAAVVAAVAGALTVRMLRRRRHTERREDTV
ncbi:copper resistance CopC family protein [Streptomyces xinghaiensis]|uniref:copper resistance CopC family protein n=1 Tax=Streptomyces xinghaiensis TaxID=1038928 RepID=UPI00031CECD3|nr:copper resistance CopC family protein [Streptomyces xinghaiensis]MZE81093.1 copper resistance protein CopC [Streptomyces sp. SID5475]